MVNILSIDERIKEVYRIFQEFFGDEMVDLQYDDEFFTRIIKVIEDHSQKLLDDLIPDWKSSLAFEDVEEEFMFTNDARFLTLESLIDRYPHILGTIIELVDSYYDLKQKPIMKILVHFPEIEVTNEYDEKTTIKHLWAKVELKRGGIGTGFFGLNRSHYTANHFANNYLHSHVSSIPTSDFSFFPAPCLGEGPIKNTVYSLTIDYNENLWRLFCLELDRYVRTESIDGVPYHKIINADRDSSISIGDCLFGSINIAKARSKIRTSKFPGFSDFITVLVRKKIIRFAMVNGTITLGMSWWDYLLAISNCYIEWVNQNIDKLPLSRRTLKNNIERFVLTDAIKKDGKFYSAMRNQMSSIPLYFGAFICSFKGRDILLEIDEPQNDPTKTTSIKLIKPEIASVILFKLLDYVNYRKFKISATGDSNPIDQDVTFI